MSKRRKAGTANEECEVGERCLCVGNENFLTCGLETVALREDTWANTFLIPITYVLFTDKFI